MTQQAKRKENNNNIFSKFWNEFLFARDFEYETPLTPDEIATALQKIEDQPNKPWFPSSSTMIHNMEYERHGDKGGDFRIDLQSKHQGKWWAGNTSMQSTEGTITANPDTGMTTIQGRTRFNGQYYVVFLLMFLSNFLSLNFQSNWFFQIVWLVFVIVFWYSMYRERNALSDRVDNIIMNAKTDVGIAHLVDQDTDDDYLNYETVISAKNYS